MCFFHVWLSRNDLPTNAVIENIGVLKVIIVKMEPKSSSYLAEQYVTNSHSQLNPKF